MYKALYRKYRPLVFADVVGQEHITLTLKSQISKEKTAHAYLFTGTRGTGKTTCAKILAKAVNCLSPKDGDPCGECEICKAIANDELVDIVEIDAASNNGVDSIRDIREEAVYTPSKAKKRVYIIDEVHMLSQGAFNALLKTLEEPPKHVLFILATTEIHKIPATILSRCQRYDFRRITSSTIAMQIEKILKKENIQYTDEAVNTIARLGDGSMRDALSVLEICASQNSVIDKELVSSLVGTTDNFLLLKFVGDILSFDFVKVYEKFLDIYKSTSDMIMFCSNLIEIFKNILIVKSAGENTLSELSKEELSIIADMAVKVEDTDLICMIDILQDTLDKMYKNIDKKTEMEMALIKLCDKSLWTSKEAMLAKINALEKKMLSGDYVVKSTPKQVKSANIENGVADKIKKISQNVINNSNNIKENNKIPFDSWADVIEQIKSIGDIMLYSFIVNTKAYIEGNKITISSDNALGLDIIKSPAKSAIIKNIILDITGNDYIFEYDYQTKKDKKDPMDSLF